MKFQIKLLFKILSIVQTSLKKKTLYSYSINFTIKKMN